MRNSHNERLLTGLALLTIISILGCSGRNDYNFPISILLIILATRQSHLDVFKITYIMLGGSTIIDIYFLKRYWNNGKAQTPHLHQYSLVMTIFEIVTKIFLIGALIYGLFGYGKKSNRTNDRQRVQPQNIQI